MALGIVFLVFAAPALLALAARSLVAQPHWNAANHDSTGQAPSPAAMPDAVVQVYAARTWGLRGGVAAHTWIAVKRAGAARYTRFEVIGWRLRRTGSALAVSDERAPDGRWFSNEPLLLADLRGAGAEAAIDKIDAAARAYPYRGEYRTWPGPNSNTFVAYVARRVPELRLDLPPTAIGKDYLAGGAAFGAAPSGTGFQVSLFGAAGVLAALREGLEVNLLGFAAGVRPWPPAVKLPGLGTWPHARPTRWRGKAAHG